MTGKKLQPKSTMLKRSMWLKPSILVLGSQEEMHLCEFGAYLVYIASSRLARPIQ